MELEINWEEKTINEKEQNELTDILRIGIYEALIAGGGSEDSEISIVMVDDETIHLLNKNYRGVDRPTDVLSFALSEKGEGEQDINYSSLFEDDVEEALEDDQDGDRLDTVTDRKVDFSVEAIMEEELELDEDNEEVLRLKDEGELLYYEDSILGDIVISIDRVRAQAQEYGHSLTREIVYLAVHGTFHLLGYDHNTDEDGSKMRHLEELVMDKIGLPR